MANSRKSDPYRRELAENFRTNLTILMDSKGWKNLDLSIAANINLSDLTKYRNETYNALPRITELAKIGKALNVTIDYLVGVDPGGRYSRLTEEEKEIIRLYTLASEQDKLVIRTLLERYKDQS